jgi:hypothetical protein
VPIQDESERKASMTTIEQLHSEDCTATRPGEKCEPNFVGNWNQPERWYVDEAIGRLGDDAPWCRVHELAWELIEAEQIEES